MSGRPRTSDRVLRIALGASILLHVVVLSIKFKFPDAFELKSNPQLEVVLVNAKSNTKPQNAELLAQASLDGGGNTDQERRAKTPLPVLPQTNRGADVVEQTQRRVQQLREQEKELVARAIEKKTEFTVPLPPPPQPSSQPSPEAPAPELHGQELAARALAMARLEASIARQWDEYQKRPKKNFVGARATEYRFARYVDDWRIKVERVGNANYPADARGRVYGSLRMTVAIKSDGSVDAVEIDRPSGYQILDRAAERIVKLAGPYSPFPADIKRDTDILVITRTFIFAPGDRLQSE